MKKVYIIRKQELSTHAYASNNLQNTIDQVIRSTCPSTITCNYNDSNEKAKIRNRYNQVPHLTRDTILESDKN